MKVTLPLLDRTFERTQGCWNCVHAGTPEVGLQHWLSACRPREDLRISQLKQAVLDVPVNAAPWQKANQQAAIHKVEKATEILAGAERAIREGLQLLCTHPRASGTSDFKSDKFLCDKWSAAQGASIARAGQAPDKLPEELRDIHGDGN